MNTIKIQLVYQEGTNLIEYPEAPELFKSGVVLDDNWLACDYYGELETYDPYEWPLTYQRLYSPYEFMTLLGFDSRVAIRTASETDVVIMDFVSMMDSAKELDLDNQDLINGINYMASVGVITQAEAERILLGTPID